MVTLKYFRGLLLSDHYAPGLKWSDDLKAYASPAYKYWDVLNYFKQAGIEVDDRVLDLIPFPLIRDKLVLREYQERALKSWMVRRRGIVVLPTGAGKTAVGIKAISTLRVSSLVVVPTLELLSQWAERIKDTLGVEPGMVGGGEDTVRGITVITYDSAYSKVEQLGNKFALIVFDEVHHLPSTGYINVGELTASPYRMGLTATPEREDGRHVFLRDIVGPVVIRISPSQLAGKYLAEFRVEKVYVELTPEEKELYDRFRKKFTDFLKKRKIRMTGPGDFQKVVFMAGRDREAREALLAWHESMRLAVNSRAKLDKLRELLTRFNGEKTIIFTRDVDMAYKVSREYLVPAVTYLTPKDERQEILEKFRNGTYKVIVASNVFDEGVDVPDASVGIILGGYGTSRQMLQRLGRILRKKEGKVATLVEIVTKGTMDHSLSRRRSSATK